MQRNLWSGHFALWTLAEALSWRIDEFGGAIDSGFKELVAIVGAGGDRRLIATGIMYRHACPDSGREPYQPWRDPPTSHPVNTFGLATVPITEWAQVTPMLTDEGRPSSNLKCSSCRLLSWGGVEFLDRLTLVAAWQPVIGLKRRGPIPALRRGIAKRILDDLHNTSLTVDQLVDMKLEELRETYGGSKNTAKAARDQALAEFRMLNPEQL